MRERGSALIVVLWGIVILSLLGLSLIHYVEGEMLLMKRMVGDSKSKISAVFALCRIVDQIRKHQKIADEDPDLKIEEEDRKININALLGPQHLILQNFLENHGIEESQAREIVGHLIDWKDADQVTFLPPHQAEESFKNAPLDHLEELLLIPGMNLEIYQKVKQDLTIFPKQGPLRIRMETASPEILLAWAESLTGPSSNTSVMDAKSLVEKIIAHRENGPIEAQEMSLIPEEEIIFRLMLSSRARISSLVSVEIEKSDSFSGWTTKVNAVVDHRTGAVYSQTSLDLL
ncbi:MAG: general secretion pathway protein GspK [Candidatus Omnitrophica bacterium]|nr:general secretion pathway protein GspK [Candidatus Omnitrophota bacterium]